jgi:methylenetetrahydrofolate dehydrogenase (NADP+)/methenyltetrahydrofolate cyclohydrolase
MIIDGNKINQEIKEGLRGHAKGLSLAILWIGDDSVSAKYIEKKKQFGEEIGVRVEVFKYGADMFTSELVEEIKSISKEFSGLIVQLPLPKQIDSVTALSTIPVDKDVDLLSDWAYQKFVEGKSQILPPVVASIKEVFEGNDLKDLKGLHAVVVGKGKLVGKPVSVWLASQGASVDLLGREVADLTPFTKNADIIVSGAGVPNLIKPEMVREGVIILDAATSDVSGKIVGDVDPAVADKAKIFSPVPGGIGPITVAMLFKNLVTLAMGPKK